jgi:hypothetical protein
MNAAHSAAELIQRYISCGLGQNTAFKTGLLKPLPNHGLTVAVKIPKPDWETIQDNWK